MDPRISPIHRRAPELAEALEPAELAALEHALDEAQPDLVRALAAWVALRERTSAERASDLPPAHLLILYALGDEPGVLLPDEERPLEAARAEVERALEAQPALRRLVARVRADRDAFYALWDEQAEVPAARPPRRPERGPAPPRARARGGARWVSRAALAVALLLFVATIIFLAQREAGFETVRTADAETRSLALPDGSEVHLAPGTTLAYRMAPGADRHLRLSGQAVFEVVPAPGTFVVETPDALVTVIGTTFGVTSGATGTEVVLVQGVVALQARHEPEQAVRLAPGERSHVVAGHPPAPPQPVDVADALAWTGTWYFRAEPMAAIAARIEQHYGVRVLMPADVAQERVTGAFRQDAPVEETLRTLASALGMQVERVADGAFRFAGAGG